MKVFVHQLMGKSFEFDLDTSANLRELQQIIATKVGFDVRMICIGSVKNQDGIKLLDAIFHDDPADEILLEFIKKQVANTEIKIKELSIFITLNLGSGHYRHTKHNPEGVSAYCGLIDNPASKFFQSVTNPAASESYSARIMRLNLTDDQIPESFLDPIFFNVMDVPVIASDQRTYDLKTLQRVNFISPFSRQPLSQSIQDNLSLRAKMEDFIASHQEEKSSIFGVTT